MAQLKEIEVTNSEQFGKLLPHIDVSPEAKKYILRRSTTAILSRSPKAGRYGYPSDALQVKCERPGDPENYAVIHADGISFYLDRKLTLENYEQLNVWLRRDWLIFRTLKARITLYRRIKV